MGFFKPKSALKTVAPIETAGQIHAVLETNLGPMRARLFLADAPQTVTNFVQLAEGTTTWKSPWSGKDEQRPFYDGLGFHRVVPGFVDDHVHFISGGLDLEEVQLRPAKTREDFVRRIAERFAGMDGVEGDERFRDIGEWGQLTTGAPVLKGCPVSFDCKLVAERNGGLITADGLVA